MSVSPAWTTPGAPPPLPPKFSLRASDALRQAAGRTPLLSDALRAAASQLGHLLTDTAAALDWRGAAARAASTSGTSTGSRLAALAARLDTVPGVLTRLAVAIEAAHSDYEQQFTQRRHLVGEWTGTLVGGYPGPGGNDVMARIRACDARMEQIAADVERADRAAAADLAGIAQTVRAMAALAAESQWLTGGLPLWATTVLAHWELVDDPRQTAILDVVAGLRDDPTSTARIRAILASLPPDDLAAFLERHPDLARRLLTAPDLAVTDALAGTLGAAAGDDATLAAELNRLLNRDHGETPTQRAALVAAFFARLTPGQARRLALLYPGMVGNLDGAPIGERVAANRVKIAVELDDVRARRAALAAAVPEMGLRDRLFEVGRDKAPDAFGTIAAVDTPLHDLEQADKRLAYLQQLLDEQVANPSPGLGRPNMMGHQVLYFDPAGDGAIAELWGSIDAGTTHVGVFVPGTTSDLTNFRSYSDNMAELAARDGTGGTATIAWMGADFPDAVAHDAGNPDYASVAGLGLRDFVAGLPVGQDVTTTVIGHSYGGPVVGVADQQGLIATRVVHVESAGLGHGVWSLADTPGGVREHYTMTAPGDPITYARVESDLQAFGVGHGGDPDTTPGVVRLETGRFADKTTTPGSMVSGLLAHSDVLTPGTTAWNNLQALISGGEVTPYTPPTVEVTTVEHYVPTRYGVVTSTETTSTTTYPYTDPRFHGPTEEVP